MSEEKNSDLVIEWADIFLKLNQNIISYTTELYRFNDPKKYNRDVFIEKNRVINDLYLQIMCLLDELQTHIEEEKENG